MEFISGNQCRQLPAAELFARLNNYGEVWVDIGTGDGRFVQQLARENSARLAIGIDACRENLQQLSRTTLSNALYLIANAENLPPELKSVADCITINFPWGSLLASLLNGNFALFDGLARLAKPDAQLQIYLNSSALAQAGCSVADAISLVQKNLRASGLKLAATQELKNTDLRVYPTTWAKRLAYGRATQTLYFRATFVALPSLIA